MLPREAQMVVDWSLCQGDKCKAYRAIPRNCLNYTIACVGNTICFIDLVLVTRRLQDPQGIYHASALTLFYEIHRYIAEHRCYADDEVYIDVRRIVSKDMHLRV